MLEYGRQKIDMMEYERQKIKAIENVRQYFFSGMESGRQKNGNFPSCLNFERHIPDTMHFGRHD